MHVPATSIQIRPARVADEADLAQLDRAAWSHQTGFPSVIEQAGAFFRVGSPPDAHLVALIDGLLADGTRADGLLAGYLRLRPASPLPENQHVFGVFGLAVAPRARRRGVAAALLAAAEQRARASGARKLSLRVFSTNDEAIRLYQRCGFQREGVLREEFLIDGRYIDDVLMSKYLANPGQ